MSVEIPLQQDMFSGALVDARSDYRKRRDRQAQQPKQMGLFSARETVQVGVNPRPWLNDLPAPTLELEIQDIRTEEEKERDWWREAHQHITPMFGEAQPEETPTGLMNGSHDAETKSPQIVYRESRPVSGVLEGVGYRARARQASVRLRRR